MNQVLLINNEADRQKNLKAALYTAGISAVILLLIFFIKFYQPVVPVTPPDEFIEINLGSSDVGSGNSQPELPSEPAPSQQTAYTPPQPTTASEESAKDVEESNRADDPPISKPAVTKPDAKNYTETKTAKANTPAANPTPAPPQPRAVMGQVRGGNGTGGNGAATYKPGTGEGPGDGQGDKGSIGGNPNGRSYAPRQLSSRVVSMPSKNFEDDFKESGKIVLDITVDENGKLLSATYQPKGSTISNRNQIDIAKRRARELSYPKYPGGFKQPHIFVFDVK